jgi:hypothetical protein
LFRLPPDSPFVSGVHARIVGDGQRWTMHNLARHELRLDGVRLQRFALTPGAEVRVGDVLLIAESTGTVHLREVLSNYLGWDESRQPVIDCALRSLRLAAAGRVPLVLRGQGDMVPIASALHRAVLGRGPFITCDPRRRRSAAPARFAESRATGTSALVAARGGTLCVRAQRLPVDFPSLCEELPRADVQFVLCSDARESRVLTFPHTTISIPSLRQRGSELDKIVGYCAQQAIDQLGILRESLTPEEHDWALQQAKDSWADLEMSVYRLLAIAASPSLRVAAARIGVGLPALRRWIDRNNLPAAVMPAVLDPEVRVTSVSPEREPRTERRASAKGAV